MSTFAMHVAKTGLNSQQIKMQVIANNLANVNTTGFKADRANFESLLYQILRGAGDNTSENTSSDFWPVCRHRHAPSQHQQASYSRQLDQHRQFT